MLYYRRKLILALIQTWGGRVGSTDLQKLLFLLAQKQTTPSFEFVPYRFGCFSWQSYADKRAMMAYGHLASEDDWQLANTSNYFDSITQDDQRWMLELKEELGHLRGDELVRLVYRRYPYYAIRSEIADKILSKSELNKVEQARPSQTDNLLFTIGYEGRSLDGFVDLLIQRNVSLLCDVRKNAYSMKYGFSKKQLAGALDGAGIRYEHMPELGVESEKRKNLATRQDYDALFEDYEKETLPLKTAWVEKIIREVEDAKRVALMCFEKDSCMCHRGRLANAIKRHPRFEYEVSHL